MADEKSQITDEALQGGFKADAGKARLDLVPADVLRKMLLRAIQASGFDEPYSTNLSAVANGLCNFWSGGNNADDLWLAINAAQEVIAADLGTTNADTVLLLGELYAIGAKKYADRNWEKGMDWGRCYAAATRHLLKFIKRERNDEVDGQHHLTSVIWCAIALMHFASDLDRYGRFDTRAVITVAEDKGQK